MITAYIQEHNQHPQDGATLVAILRSPLEYSAFMCSTSSEAIGDGVCCHLRGGLREEHVQLASRAAEAVLIPRWQPPSRKRSRDFQRSASPKAAFERVFHEVVERLLFFPLAPRGGSSGSTNGPLSTELGQGVWHEEWTIGDNPEENEDPWANQSDTSDVSGQR
eukprot:CAMPEP_0172747536 /NCGR_PEP_ID=MMETSP1074-20121228/142989_1 /TAXON_ID=2916 /ORGANISM="Ceratium fusus, Strain PA161109" /LENGTH=163 /DNA_ID=CAMNT_0013579079 /DNA_START=26 /DNA_END=517 /DNA_ORIENTATION=+